MTNVIFILILCLLLINTMILGYKICRSIKSWKNLKGMISFFMLSLISLLAINIYTGLIHWTTVVFALLVFIAMILGYRICKAIAKENKPWRDLKKIFFFRIKLYTSLGYKFLYEIYAMGYNRSCLVRPGCDIPWL